LVVLALTLVTRATPGQESASGTASPASIESGGHRSFPLSPRNANYSITARLNPATRSIDASETIVWRNITSRATSELRFHLYWNAWRDTRSTFFRERALAGAAPPRSDAAFARLDVQSIRVRSSPESGGPPADLTGRMRFIAPDDANEHDQTVMAVALPSPVQPGQSLTIELEWTAKVPRPFARTGVVGHSYFVAQWFPKLGVLEDTGWNCHQFHATTEFFSDFGVYDVRLTVPHGWIVGATGRERLRTDNADGTTTHHYHQEDVHDFAWTTSPTYLVRQEKFEHPGLPPVEMRLLYQPEHAGQEERHFGATRTALRRFGEWFGAYPYEQITIVDPAWQSGAGGMEYPTLITAGTRWLVGPRVTLETPEEVTVHEAGHQFFYGIVATNEFEHAWMDEGMTTFAAARAVAEDHPDTYLEQRYFGGFVPWVFKDIRLRRETFWNRLAGYRPAAKTDDPSGPSHRFHPAQGRSITYNKTALWLNTLERWLGWPVLQAGMSKYFERGRFRHPKPDDFFASISEASDEDVTWFFDEVHRSSNVFDYAVQDLRSTKVDDRFRTMVIVRRYGEAIFPVDIVVRFADGEEVTEAWDGRSRWTELTYERSARALSAAVDPRRVLLLDVNYTNNSRTLEPDGPRAATKWAAKWLVWLQDALLTWSFLV
jgi:aminopeptidase N